MPKAAALGKQLSKQRVRNVNFDIELLRAQIQVCEDYSSWAQGRRQRQANSGHLHKISGVSKVQACRITPQGDIHSQATADMFSNASIAKELHPGLKNKRGLAGE